MLLHTNRAFLESKFEMDENVREIPAGMRKNVIALEKLGQEVRDGSKSLDNLTKEVMSNRELMEHVVLKLSDTKKELIIMDGRMGVFEEDHETLKLKSKDNETALSK